MISTEMHDTAQQITKAILRVMIPEQIILIAYIDQQGKRFSVLSHPIPVMIHAAAIYLLIISNKEEHLKPYWSNSLEQQCSSLCDVSCTIFSSSRINDLAQKGNQLIVPALQSGIVLYQKWEPALHIRNTIQQLTTRTVPITELHPWQQRSLLFYQTAINHHQQGNWGMTAFCIHQAAEQLLMMLHIAATGTTIPLHNLNSLLRRLRFFYDEIASKCFTRTAAEEKKLMQLNQVYVDYRYHTIQLAAADIDYFFQVLNAIQYLAERYVPSALSLPGLPATATQGKGSP